MNWLTTSILCTGIAPTTPATSIEIDIRPGTYSTIRYEYMEGPLEGTAYIQSIGYMNGSRKGDVLTFKTGDKPQNTLLVIQLEENEIKSAHFSHYVSGMNKAPVECGLE